MEYKKEKINLTNNNSNLFYYKESLLQKEKALEEFLCELDFLNNIEFSKSVLLSQEIKSNNTIEGYNDDINIVQDIIKNKKEIKDIEKLKRIKNLFNGYKYILNKEEINRDNLKKLYNILSKGLLSYEDLNNMGEYYRKNSVNIFYSDKLSVPPDTGMDSNIICERMNELFEYINKSDISSTTDSFIKSQILHFQFVNVHPYYDINGRTSRTTSMWYLLNKESYPFIIFNRGINYHKNIYNKIIRETRIHGNLTYFLNYMLDDVRLELEKETIMNMIKQSSGHLTTLDYQTMNYILSMNSILTVLDYTEFYNKYNDKKSPNDIYNEILLPLFDKKIIIPTRETDSYINSNMKNIVFEINKSKYEMMDKIKYLKIR